MSLLDVNHVYKTYYINDTEENLWRRFWRVNRKKLIKAVEDINIHIERGEIIGFIGKNGAGKSTTIKMMTGILQPDKGSVELNGINSVSNRKKYVKNIGCVFGQRSQLWWDLPVIDSFKLLKEIYEVSDVNYDNTLKEIENLIAIEMLLDRPVRQLSLGQRMRCEIVAAFLHKPQIVFLDEPTIGLDIIAKEDIRKIILYLNKMYRTTIVIASHDMKDIEELCNRVIVLDKGSIIFEGELDQLKRFAENIKIVEVISKDLFEINLNGVKLIKDEGKKKVFEVNLDFISVPEFMAQLSNKTAITDLEVRGIGIEEIVKEIYKS